MSKAMDMLDVVKVLMEGGYICWSTPKVSGTDEYNVLTLPDERGISRPVGHITATQFETLNEKRIITAVPHEPTDKNGRLYTWFQLMDPAVCKMMARAARGDFDDKDN